MEPNEEPADDGQGEAWLGQATVYLAEASVTEFVDLIKGLPEDANDPSYDVMPLANAAGLDGVVYVQRYPATDPGWKPSLAAVVDGDLPDLSVRQAGAALLVRLAGRIFAFTFGQGRHLLDRDKLVDDFGLRVAANTVDPRRVRSIDGRTFERGVLLTRRQASIPGRVEALGVQVDREMYRAITGRSSRAGEGRVHGSTSLGVTRDITLAGLETLGETLLRDYDALDYQASFRSLDRMQPLKKDAPEVGRLNELLIRNLRAPSSDAFLAPPALLDWADVSGFRLSTDATRQTYNDPDLSVYLAGIEGGPPSITIERLVDDELRVVARDSPRVSHRWSIYRSVVFETTLDGVPYILSEGRWYRVDRQYLDWVDSTVAGVLDPGIGLPSPSVPGLVEGLYNAEAATHLGAVLLDTLRAHVATERGGFELCDIFLPPDKLIHVKRGMTSDALTYLFNQGVQAAEGYRNAPEVRARLRELVARSDAAAAAALPSDDRPDRDAFQIVYVIVTDSPARVPRRLPFFARASLARAVRTLTELDFRYGAVGVPTRP